MAPVKTIAILILLFLPGPGRAESVEQWRPHITEASERFGIPSAWIERVMRAESGGRTRLGGRPITSHAGAMGLMQLMPGTWREMRAALGLGADPHNPRDNIIAGTAYLRLMHDRFGYPGLFAAYNAGPQRYARHLATGRPLPGETRAYVIKVAGRAMATPSDPPSPRAATMLTRVAPTTAAGPRARPDPPATTLFVVLRPEPRSATSRIVSAQPPGLFVPLSQP